MRRRSGAPFPSRLTIRIDDQSGVRPDRRSRHGRVRPNSVGRASGYRDTLFNDVEGVRESALFRVERRGDGAVSSPDGLGGVTTPTSKVATVPRAEPGQARQVAPPSRSPCSTASSWIAGRSRPAIDAAEHAVVDRRGHVGPGLNGRERQAYPRVRLERSPTTCSLLQVAWSDCPSQIT